MGLTSVVRRTGKAALRRSPHTYRLAQSGFIAAKLMADRRAFQRRHPHADYVLYSKAELEAIGTRGFVSQYGQDYYLWTSLLDHDGGSFADIGANHPLHLSNSLYLEQHGWTGVAIDPLASMAPLWRTSRSTTFHAAAVSRLREFRTYTEIKPREGWEHTLSGFSEFVRPEDLAMYDHEHYQVPCAPLAHYLPGGVDLIFIDVEGAEMQVLEGIDFDRLEPRVIMVENVGTVGGGESVRDFLAARGFSLVARVGGSDDLFVRRVSPTDN